MFLSYGHLQLADHIKIAISQEILGSHTPHTYHKQILRDCGTLASCLGLKLAEVLLT